MDAMKLMNKLLEGCNSADEEPAMPELTPLPCPLCGASEPKVNRGCGVVTCCEISVDDVSAWNALPRALRWTNEPPKVAGKYWWRHSGKKIGRIRDMFVRNGEVGFLDHNDRFIKDTGDGEWAGPIPAPID